jgi:hypothetical protein
MLDHILKYCSLESKINLYLSCKSLKHVILYSNTAWKAIHFPKLHASFKTLSLENMIYYTLSIGHIIGHRLIELNVNGTGQAFTDSHLSMLTRNTPHLKFLDITGSSVGKKGLQSLLSSRSCLNLQHLYLINIPGLDDSILQMIGDNCIKLKSLDISVFAMEGQFTDRGFSDIANGCHELETIICIGCHSITDETLKYLGTNCKGLKRVDFSGAFLVTDLGLKRILIDCKYLEIISFSYCWRITDDGFRSAIIEDPFSGQQLTSISLSFCYQLS